MVNKHHPRSQELGAINHALPLNGRFIGLPHEFDPDNPGHAQLAAHNRTKSRWSSVFKICRFMYWSMDFREPLYSMPQTRRIGMNCYELAMSELSHRWQIRIDKATLCQFMSYSSYRFEKESMNTASSSCWCPAFNYFPLLKQSAITAIQGSPFQFHQHEFACWWGKF